MRVPARPAASHSLPLSATSRIPIRIKKLAHKARWVSSSELADTTERAGVLPIAILKGDHGDYQQCYAE